MHRSIALLSALVASVIAQNSAITSSATAVTSTATQEMPVVATQSFNPGLVDRTTALAWCRGQSNTCIDICGGRVSSNSCDEMTFTYGCTCSNGTVPDCTAFQQSLPYFICEQTYAQCLNNTPSTDPAGQQVCINDRQCGTRNATAERYATASSSSSTSASSSSTGSASASGASSTSSSAAAAVASVTPVSTGAFVALLFALCKLVL